MSKIEVTFQRIYNFDVSDLGNQGTQITLSKHRGAFGLFSLFVAGAAVLVLAYHANHLLNLRQNYILVLSILVTVGFIIKYLTSLHTESILVISSIGLTIKQESLLTSSTKYFDVQQIKDVVIVEAVALHSITFQIVLVPQSGCGKNKKKIYPLFKAFQPCLDDLKTIYRHVQDKLILPHQQTVQI